MALGTVPAITGLATSAGAAVTVGSNISVFPDRDFVGAMGYELGEQLLIEVVRNGVVIGTTQGAAMETPEGNGLEVNHGPEGTPAPGECWTSYTPDIIGGDVVRVTALDRAGTPVDTTTVADVTFVGDPYLDANNNVAVDGTGTVPLGDIAVEFRRDKPDPRFRGGPFLPVANAAGGWTATYRVGSVATTLTPDQQRNILLNEASWAAVVDKVTETTLAELGETPGVAAGCTGSADPNTLVGGLAPINIASGDVTFSGTARAGVAGVSVKVGTLNAKDATVVANGTNPSTWTLTVPKSELAGLPDGSVTVTPTFDTVTGASRTVLKDTVAPQAPNPSVAPGTYSTTQAVALNKPAGEGTSTIYWEIGNTGVQDPDASSNLYTSQIQVTSDQTIKGRLIDAAGNLGTVGTFAYRIGTPPAAPTGLTATESTTAAGAANLRWTAAPGATGYNVYRNDVRVNATRLPSTATTYSDTSAGEGDHSYVVRAVETNGIESINSNVAAVTIAAPAVPSGLRATGGDARVTLNWTAATGVANYRIYRDGVALSTLAAGTASSYTNTGLTNNTLYEYAIAALDAGGNESARTGVVQAVPAVAADTTPPPAPTVNPATGTYSTTQSVTMSNTEAGAVIRYTIGTGTTVPADPTATSAQYTGAIAVGSSQVIKAAAFDAAGNRSTITQRNYTITTGGDTAAPTVAPSAPQAGATGVSQTNNITMRFSEAVQGVTGSTVVLTNTATGAVIPSGVTYKSDTLGTILNPNATLAAGTNYTVTVTGGSTAIRDLAGNPLVTRRWSFTTTGTSTTNTAPTVTSRSPASGATGVAIGSNVTATFNEPVQGVSGSTFTLRASNGTVVSAPVSYNSTTRVATLNPGANLAPGTTYTATLTGGTSAIRDSQNLALATTTWSFTTASSTTTSNTAPTLVSRSPGINATGASRTNNVTLRFSEAVQGVSASTVYLRNTATGAAISSTVTYKSDTFGVILNPGITLAANTRYTVFVTNGIRDLPGLAFAGTSWTFTTGS